MAIKWGKTERNKMIAVLEAEYATVEEAADAVLEAGHEILVSRARYTVVGQLRKAPETRWTGPGEAEASKGCLGFYSTAGEAQKAAEGLFYNSQTHEEWAAWVLPVEHVTANDFHKARKLAKAEAAAAELEAAKAAAKATDTWAEDRAREIREFIESLPEAERKAVQRRIGAAEWARVEGMADRAVQQREEQAA